MRQRTHNNRAFASRPLVAAAVSLWIVCGTASAEGGRGVVVQSFSGPHGAEATKQVAAALRGLRVVDSARYRRAVRQMGAKKAARSLGVAGVVRGSIARVRGRWSLRITVTSGVSNRSLGQRVFPLRGRRLDPGTTRSVARAIGAVLRHVRTTERTRHGAARARKGKRTGKAGTSQPTPAAGATAPGFDDGSDFDQGGVIVDDGLGDYPGSASGQTKTTPSKHVGSPLGFAVTTPGGRQTAVEQPSSQQQQMPTEGTRGAPQGRAPKAQATDAQRPWQPIVEASIGVTLLNRSFAFDRAQNKPPELATPGVLPAISLQAAGYPLAALLRGPAADIGITGTFFHALGAKAEVDPTNKRTVDTVLQAFEIGLCYRWNLLAEPAGPVLRPTLAYGQQTYAFSSGDGQPDPLPDITYTFLKPGLTLEWPFVAQDRLRLGADVSLNYLVVFSAGDIENTNSTGYGPASIIALDGSLGVFGSFAGFFARLSGFYRRFEFDFERTCGSSGCKVAAGAADGYAGGSLHLGYAY